MARQIFVWETDDGEHFDSQAAAEAYENEVVIVEELTGFIYENSNEDRNGSSVLAQKLTGIFNISKK